MSRDPLLEELKAKVFTPIPRFDPQPGRTALLTIDVQYFDGHPDHGIGRSAKATGSSDLLRQYYEDAAAAVRNVRRLQDAARMAGVELIHVAAGPLTADTREMGATVRERLEGSRTDLKEFDILPEAAPHGDEMVLRKITSSTFISTSLDLILHNMGIDTLVICGLVTNGCVESTVRDARDLGFRVILVSDACATWTRDLHENALRYISISHGNVRSTDDVISAMRSVSAVPA
jgi:ureidoacrylate peracid hydrolase